MTIKVNGKVIGHIDSETITQLLKRMNFIFPLIVVKIDGVVILKKKFPDTMIPDGSKVEVIHLISGG